MFTAVCCQGDYSPLDVRLMGIEVHYDRVHEAESLSTFAKYFVTLLYRFNRDFFSSSIRGLPYYERTVFEACTPRSFRLCKRLHCLVNLKRFKFSFLRIEPSHNF